MFSKRTLTTLKSMLKRVSVRGLLAGLAASGVTISIDYFLHLELWQILVVSFVLGAFIGWKIDKWL